MSIAELEEQIAAVTNEIGALREPMEGAAVTFRVAVSSFAARWMREYTRKLIQDNHEHVQSVGLPELRTLRERIDDVVAQVPALVDEYLTADELWPHRGSLERTSVGSSSRYGGANVSLSAADDLSVAVRRVLGHVFEPLNMAGLVTTDRRVPSSDWKVYERGSPGVIFGHTPEESAEVKSALRQYAQFHLRLASGVDRLAALTERKKREEALRRFEDS